MSTSQSYQIPVGFIPPPPGNHLGFAQCCLHPGGPRVSEANGDKSVRPPDDCEPNETLYVNNLNDRVKEKEMKLYLEKLFSAHGRCEVIVMSSLRRRGQAWITFEDIESATAARSALHEQLAFGKKMRVSFSRNVSDKTRMRKGLPARIKEQLHIQPGQAKEEPQAVASRTVSGIESFFKTGHVVPKTASRSYFPPNKLLLVENLSADMPHEKLLSLFSGFPGFVELRVIASRGIAFVEYVDEYKSQEPLMKLQSLELEPGRHLTISNARL